MGMNVVVIGCGHWHLGLYLEPLLLQPGLRVAGVSDPQLDAAQAVGERLGCAAYASYADLCDATRPDLALVLGRHCDMAEAAQFLIERDIPCAVEKPCGLNLAELTRLSEAANERGAFAAVPLVWRQTGLAHLLRERLDDDRLTNLSFRLIAGPPSRYVDARCEWMLDPALSGGGCTINLGVHFVDLLAWLTGEPVELEQAFMDNGAFGLPVEDYSLLVLRAGAAACTVETAYLYPAPTTEYDMRFSIRSDRHYAIATGPAEVQLTDASGERRTIATHTTNVDAYPVFVADLVRRVRHDEPPVAGLDDMAAAMQVLQSAYARAAVTA
jgi:predicted dehydrogenase